MKNRTRTPKLTRQRFGIEDAATQVRDLMQEAISQVQRTARPGEKSQIFPNGIDLLYIRLEFGAGAAIKGALELKLAGPPTQGASLTRG